MYIKCKEPESILNEKKALLRGEGDNCARNY
jgi:hypothetical protein